MTLTEARERVVVLHEVILAVVDELEIATSIIDDVEDIPYSYVERLKSLTSLYQSSIDSLERKVGEATYNIGMYFKDTKTGNVYKLVYGDGKAFLSSLISGCALISPVPVKDPHKISVSEMHLIANKRFYDFRNVIVTTKVLDI